MLYGIPLTYEGSCDVERLFQFYFKQLTNICVSLFKINNLPENIDPNFLIEQLVLTGRVCFTQFNSHVYALNGSLGGEPDCYYHPTQFIIANPILGSKTVKVRHKDGRQSIEGLDGIVVSLTTVDQDLELIRGGLYELIYKTAGLLADNASSLNCAQINGRMSVAFSADSQAEANSAEEVLKDIYSGKPYRVLSQNILEKITATPIATSGTNQTITTLIEAERSIYQDFFNAIGIGYQGNSKRERVNTAEVGLMRGCLDVSLWNMENSLKDGFDKVNELFGTSIEIEVNDEVFYAGSGNATFGSEEDPIPTTPEEETVDEKNTEETVEILETKGKEKKEGGEEE